MRREKKDFLRGENRENERLKICDNHILSYVNKIAKKKNQIYDWHEKNFNSKKKEKINLNFPIFFFFFINFPMEEIYFISQIQI